MPPKNNEAAEVSETPKVSADSGREQTGQGTHVALARGYAKSGIGFVLVERGEPVPSGNPVSTEWMAPADEAAAALAETAE